MESIEQRELTARASASDGEPRRGALAAVLSWRAAYLIIGALAVGFVIGRLQFSTRAICCGDFDGYYHIRWSQLLWEGLRAGHFPPVFRWLPLTALNPRDYVDHHLLFHVLQIPFAVLSEKYTGDAILGAKISAWLFASLAIFSCYWLVVRYGVRYPLVWLVALLGSSAPFLFRMNMTKAMSVSIVLLVFGIHLLFRRKYAWLLPLAFLFTLTYDMFLLLCAAALIWTGVVAWSERRFEWRPLLWVGIGVVAGLVLNPYFPHDLVLLYQHAVMKIGVTNAERPQVGQEWYPYDSWVFLGNCAVAFAAMVIGYVTFNWNDPQRAARPLFFLVFSTLLLVANAKWRRFAEYWPPFAVLFAAFSVNSLLAGALAFYGRLPDEVMRELRPYLDRSERAGEAAQTQRRWTEAEAALAGLVLGALAYALFVLPQLPVGARKGIAIAAAVLPLLVYTFFRGVSKGSLATVFLVLVVSALFTVRAERGEIAESDPPESYRGGISWLRANVPPGETVFNTDWDDFPKLFFYDPSHAYVSGLDPTYLYDQNPELSKLYEQITLGKEKDPGPLIRERFHARYVFTDNDPVHDDFYDAALDSGWFEEAYSDDTCTVLRIRDQKGEPPPDEGDDQPDDAPDASSNSGGE